MPERPQLSRALVELLAAYGEAPEPPKYNGDLVEYATAVRQYEKLTTTPIQQARLTELQRYFDTERAEPHT